jgi:amino acid transporter
MASKWTWVAIVNAMIFVIFYGLSSAYLTPFVPETGNIAIDWLITTFVLACIVLALNMYILSRIKIKGKGSV